MSQTPEFVQRQPASSTKALNLNQPIEMAGGKIRRYFRLGGGFAARRLLNVMGCSIQIVI